jgi:hypothetical protein
VIARATLIDLPEAASAVADQAPHPSARFGAGEFLVISGGDLHQVDEVAGWLAETGWRCTGRTALPPPSGVIEAVPD